MEAELFSFEFFEEEALARRASALATVRAKQRLARAAFDQGVVGVVGAPAMPDLK